MSEDFSIENGMLTPTLKLKRKEALKKYAAEIESMYTKSSLWLIINLWSIMQALQWGQGQ